MDSSSLSTHPPLRSRIARRLPLLAWLLIVLLALVELWMIAATIDRPSNQWGPRGYEAVLALSFGSIGALIASRQPRNLNGWLLLVFGGLSLSLVGVIVQYPVLAEASQPPLPGAFLARWVVAWAWIVPAGTFLVIFPLFFPDGHLPSPRWRGALLFGIVGVVVVVVETIVLSQPIGPVPPSNSPTAYFDIVGPSAALGYVLYWLAATVSVASLVQRYRHAQVEQRQQIKWVAAALALAALGAVGGSTPVPILQGMFLAATVLCAAAIAIAIFRYRLYDIDFIVNRTIVYGVMSAILAGVYTASITLSQRVFIAITGDRSDAAIVLTTLVVAATFTPVKTRLQAIVDRRVKAPAPPPAPTEQTAPAPGDLPAPTEKVELLVKLASLHQEGALTASELRAAKAILLSAPADPEPDAREQH